MASEKKRPQDELLPSGDGRPMACQMAPHDTFGTTGPTSSRRAAMADSVTRYVVDTFRLK